MDSLSRARLKRRHQLHKYTRAKYLRKFANDTMTSEKLNIPEIVADFIQGRVPKSIGVKHYMQLKRKADQFYPRYAEHVTELRRKAGIITAQLSPFSFSFLLLILTYAYACIGILLNCI
ncbi:MAG: integrase [Candidatus Bathyarchaeia archaeon]